MTLHRIELIVDDDDYRAINEAIAKEQAALIRIGGDGGSVLADGEGNLAGRYLGEIVRDWLEYKERLESR